MIDSAHILDVLFGRGNVLWRRETEHEAMLLLKAFYKKANPPVREMITSEILAGPPPHLLSEDTDEERGNEKDRIIFEILTCLELEHLPLVSHAESKLSEIRQRHLEWKPARYPESSMSVESGVLEEAVPADAISSATPEDAADQIIRFRDNPQESLRSICEAIGIRITRDPEWGLRVMDTLDANVQSLPKNAMNPIFWGIRAAVTDNISEITNDHISTIFKKLLAMTEKRSIPTMWSSLPNLMQALVGKFDLPVETWNELSIRLASIFEDFDYERANETKPIDWRHKAINHPYGDTTELYLMVSQQHVNALSAAGKALDIGSHAENFFSHMLAHYNIGSRYGLCLLAPWLSWIEAVSPKVAALLYPYYEWGSEDERSLVAWSGYLWSNTLSRRLVENFANTYLTAAEHHSELASQERTGLATHVSAMFWSYPDELELLYKFATRVDSDLRGMLLQGWKRHLANAQETSAIQFFEKVIFPYWDWCSRQHFFNGPEGSWERFGFWELAPLSFEYFPEACQRALNRRPSILPHTGTFLSDVINDSTSCFPDALAELLIAFLDIDINPHWHMKDWDRGWRLLKNAGTKRLMDLANALAKKGISPEHNQ